MRQYEASATQIAGSGADGPEREDGVREKVMHRSDVKKPAQGGLVDGRVKGRMDAGRTLGADSGPCKDLERQGGRQ